MELRVVSFQELEELARGIIGSRCSYHNEAHWKSDCLFCYSPSPLRRLLLEMISALQRGEENYKKKQVLLKRQYNNLPPSRPDILAMMESKGLTALEATGNRYGNVEFECIYCPSVEATYQSSREIQAHSIRYTVNVFCPGCGIDYTKTLEQSKNQVDWAF